VRCRYVTQPVSAGLVNNGSSRAPGKGGVTSGRAAARKGID